MPSQIIYTTDVHGNEEIYEELFAMGEQPGIAVVLIGGDTSPGFDIEMQRRFFERYLIPRIQRFRAKTGKPVFIIMGNDDFFINTDLFKKAEKGGILTFLHGKVDTVGGWHFAGYTCINPGPLFIRDWIRDEGEIAHDLEKIGKKCDMKKTVFVFHAPPYGTALDVIYNGEHVGSTAILNFIKKRQPALTLHGHIHESPTMTGKFHERIGKTLAINPGNANFVIVDLDTMKIVTHVKH